MDEPLMTTEDLARLLRTTPGNVRNQAWKAAPGEWPPSFRLGNRRMYRRADVDAWIEQRIAAERNR